MALVLYGGLKVYNTPIESWGIVKVVALGLISESILVVVGTSSSFWGIFVKFYVEICFIVEMGLFLVQCSVMLCVIGVKFQVKR